jgi:acyl dehydratase
LAVCWHLLGALVEEAQGAQVVPLNPSLVGRRYQEVSCAVTREHVERFAEAIGERSPIYRDADAARAAGYADQVAPPTFVTVMQIMASAQVVLDQELGLDYSRVVHGEQEYEWHRPVVVGDVLTATPQIAGISAHGPNEFLVIESEVHDASGETVVVARSTLLSRGTARA